MPCLLGDVMLLFLFVRTSVGGEPTAKTPLPIFPGIHLVLAYPPIHVPKFKLGESPAFWKGPFAVFPTAVGTSVSFGRGCLQGVLDALLLALEP